MSENGASGAIGSAEKFGAERFWNGDAFHGRSEASPSALFIGDSGLQGVMKSSGLAEQGGANSRREREFVDDFLQWAIEHGVHDREQAGEKIFVSTRGLAAPGRSVRINRRG